MSEPAADPRHNMKKTTVRRLRQVCDFIREHGHGDIPWGRKPSGLRYWLYSACNRERDRPTNARRAALVRLGYLAPNGDESRFRDDLPSFLQEDPPRFGPVRPSAAVPVLADIERRGEGTPGLTFADGGEDPADSPFGKLTSGFFYDSEL